MFVTIKNNTNTDYEEIKVLDFYLEIFPNHKVLWQKLNAPRDLYLMTFDKETDLEAIKSQIKSITPKHDLPLHYKAPKLKSIGNEMDLQKRIIEFFRTIIQKCYPDATLYVDVMKSLAGGKDYARLVSIAKHYGLEKHNPDIVIVCSQKGYSGIAIELKKETPFKKDGTLKSQKVERKNRYGIVTESYDHNEKQMEKLIALRQNNFYATYAIDYNQTINILCEYFNLRV